MAIVLDGTTGITTPAIDAGNDVGQVATFAMSTAPTGWLKANGAAVSRTTYADLFAAIGTTFGAGDGSTTFLLPDLRGEFIRGWDDGRGVDSGRAFGSAQAFDLQSHAHPIGANIGSQPATPASVATYNNIGRGATIGTDAVGGTETRPRNVALLACIKF
jgi:microcystin-dependent protein